VVVGIITQYPLKSPCEKWNGNRHWWLTPVILVLRRQRSRGPQLFERPYLEKTYHKKGLVEWFQL
jgi:hypothetical protein